jgi:hypothetical protein
VLLYAAEYLVFLHRESIEGKVVSATPAAFAIEYRPDSAGRVIGMLYGEGHDRRTMSVGAVRTMLRRIVSGERIGSDAERVLDRLLRAAALSPASLMVREPATFEQRFEQVKALAGRIRLGTLRADIEKVSPNKTAAPLARVTRATTQDQKSWLKCRSTKEAGRGVLRTE